MAFPLLQQRHVTSLKYEMMEMWKLFCQNNFDVICQYVKVGEEGAGTVEKVWGGRFTDLRFSLVFSLRYIT